MAVLAPWRKGVLPGYRLPVQRLFVLLIFSAVARPADDWQQWRLVWQFFALQIGMTSYTRQRSMNRPTYLLLLHKKRDGFATPHSGQRFVAVTRKAVRAFLAPRQRNNAEQEDNDHSLESPGRASSHHDFSFS
jgi:hypothetical protein